MIAAPQLAGLLIRVRFRILRNAIRWRGGRAPLLPMLLGLFTALAYLGLFSQSFAAIVAATDGAGQAAALSLIVGAIVLGALAAKASANDAVLAGSPENELLLTRPVSLPALLVARSLAEAVTDPFGALFIFPVLITAALTWHLGPLAWIAAALTSMIVQIGTSAAAQAIQIAVVRYTRPERRRLIWVGLRLLALLALAALWMTGTWVLRAPRVLAEAAASMGGLLGLTPGAAITAPLVALRLGHVGAAVAGLVGLAAATAVVLALSFAVARRAGMHGWEEAGASWAEASARPAGPKSGRRAPRPLTAATKDLRLILRDRSQLMKLIAMPIIFVGIQLFGAAGWSWSTARPERVAVLAFSLCLYMATIGPLGHMQAERRAFWILRTVPVPIGRLMAAKARSWSVVLGALSAAAFVSLSLGVQGGTLVDRLVLGLLVVAGTVGVAWLAVAFGCQAADLSDEQQPAIGAATVYLFLLVGALYNLVLAGDADARVRGLVLYGFAIFAFWTSGMQQAARCLDPESRRLRPLRLGDAATFVLVAYLGRRAAAMGAVAASAGPDAAAAASIAAVVVTALVGLCAAAYLARRRAGARRGPVPARLAGGALALVAIVVGLLAAHRGGGLPAPPAMGLAAALLLCEELVFRGVLQRGLEQHGTAIGDDGGAGLAPGRARILAAAVATALGFVASGAPLGPVAIASHAAASLAQAATGAVWVAWLARLALVAILGLG